MPVTLVDQLVVFPRLSYDGCTGGHLFRRDGVDRVAQ